MFGSSKPSSFSVISLLFGKDTLPASSLLSTDEVDGLRDSDLPGRSAAFWLDTEDDDDDDFEPERLLDPDFLSAGDEDRDLEPGVSLSGETDGCLWRPSCLSSELDLEHAPDAPGDSVGFRSSSVFSDACDLLGEIDIDFSLRQLSERVGDTDGKLATLDPSSSLISGDSSGSFPLPGESSLSAFTADGGTISALEAGDDRLFERLLLPSPESKDMLDSWRPLLCSVSIASDDSFNSSATRSLSDAIVLPRTSSVSPSDVFAVLSNYNIK